MVLLKLDSGICKNVNRSISITLKSVGILGLNIQLDTLTREVRQWSIVLNAFRGDNFLNRTLTAQALKLMIKKWNIMKLKNFYKLRTLSIGPRSSLQNEKIFFLPTSHLIEISYSKYLKN